MAESTSGGTAVTTNVTSDPILLNFDPVAAGANPEQQMVPHVDPYDAAKEMRKLVAGLRDAVPEMKELSSDPYLSQFIADLAAVLGRSLKAQDLLIEATRTMKEQMPYLRAAIESRRAAEGRIQFERINEVLGQMNYNLAVSHERTLRAIQFKDKIATRIKKGSGELALAPSTFKTRLDKLHKLVQAIPTQPNMPLPNQAANTLRAIAAILKVNGYITSSVPVEEAKDVVPNAAVTGGIDSSGGSDDGDD